MRDNVLVQEHIAPERIFAFRICEYPNGGLAIIASELENAGISMVLSR